MSIEAMTWAKKQRVGSPIGKAILMMLADYADRDCRTFAGQKRLAEECECSERVVRKWLAEFESKGLISREERRREGGSRTSDMIVLRMQQPAPDSASQPAPNAGEQPAPRAGSAKPAEKGKNRGDAEVINRHVVPRSPAPDSGHTNRKNNYPPSPPNGAAFVEFEKAFEQVIEAWPRFAEDHREEAWRLFRELPEADQAKLLTAAKGYPAECRQEAARRGRTFDAHIPYTKTLPKWIEDRRWQSSKPLPSTTGMQSLNRADPLYAACCRIEGNRAALTFQSCFFKDETVKAARYELIAERDDAAA